MRLPLVFAVVLCLVNVGSAVDWSGGVGDFLSSANWQGGAVPGAGDTATINNGGTAQLSTGTAEASTLDVGIGAGSGNFVQTGGDFMAEGAIFGNTGTGSAKISGGNFVIGGQSIHVGLDPGGVGVMTIDSQNALVSSGDDYQLGRDGTGTLNFSAGQLVAGYTVVGKFGTGLWNQSGGLFRQAFGDVEIADGGRDDQVDTPGPRLGTMNLTGGVLQTSGDFAIGNRRGTGTVNVAGGVIAATGKENSAIYVGRGMNNSPNEGGPTTLKVTGASGIIVASGDFNMNSSEVSVSSTLIEDIMGINHTTVRVGGSADIANGNLKVQLNGYAPKANDSWLLIEAGVELDGDFAAIDALVDAVGYDPLTHALPTAAGTVIGKFKSVDTSSAALSPGLSWDVSYTATKVVLSVIGGAGILGDFDGNGVLGVEDIDALSVAIRSGGSVATFDVNNDQALNGDDRKVWVEQLRKTYFGDSNLDGEFSSADFVVVFQAGQYEDTTPGNSTWGSGDWNGDSEFTSSDFVVAFQGGGFEQGPRAAVAVPEPSNWLLAVMAVLGLIRRAAENNLPTRARRAS